MLQRRRTIQMRRCNRLGSWPPRGLGMASSRRRRNLSNIPRISSADRNCPRTTSLQRGVREAGLAVETYLTLGRLKPAYWHTGFVIEEQCRSDTLLTLILGNEAVHAGGAGRLAVHAAAGTGCRVGGRIRQKLSRRRSRGTGYYSSSSACQWCWETRSPRCRKHRLQGWPRIRQIQHMEHACCIGSLTACKTSSGISRLAFHAAADTG